MQIIILSILLPEMMKKFGMLLQEIASVKPLEVLVQVLLNLALNILSMHVG